MLLTNRTEGLQKFSKMVKVPEMIISTLFLLTGIYMLTQIPEIKTMLIVKIVIVFASIPVAIIAFKKSNKALAAVSLLMIISAYGLAEMSKKHNTTTAAPAGNNGQEIYSANCSRCHGDDGKAGITGASDLSLIQLDNAGIEEIIKNGKGAMTGFVGALSEEQIKAVVEYVLLLKSKQDNK